MNDYYSKILDFQNTIIEYANNIFRTYGRELILRLEEYNVLQDKLNCIESSTAIGYILEEFIVSKLQMYTNCDNSSKYVIQRFRGATSSESYDCFSIKDGIKFLINIKTEKSGNANNAISAISQLYRDYCLTDPEKEKAFIILKITYKIGDSYEGDSHKAPKPRHIFISNIASFCLEEIDFSKEHKQDGRNWSVTNPSSNTGRLLVSDKFRKDHKVPENIITYKNTKNGIESIIKRNEEKVLKK